MIALRKSQDRGFFDHGWLKSHHTFSFADYYDPKHMHFSHLRVINEDYVAPGRGFGTHPHRDMEIVTYILSGALTHEDSMGNGSVIRPGDVQRMSAGTGVLHSEFNHSPTETVHLLQIWILPNQSGITPDYEQKNFSNEVRKNRLCLIASSDGRDGSVLIHQNASVFASMLDQNSSIDTTLTPGRKAWLQVTSGEVSINGIVLNSGDAAAIQNESAIKIEGRQPSEFILFDLV
jgi:redox-sensitive bicupin YhaK (pirin superfamily)